LIAGIASEQKRLEILDWYHLKENLYKLGGSLAAVTEGGNKSMAWSD
jgi:hypothetical protein